MNPHVTKIIFTDLDMTLLDEDYSYKDALPSLEKIRKEKIPLIICSSKTCEEIEYYRKKLKNTEPFIVENGGAVFIPKGYFGFKFHYDNTYKNYHVIKIGSNHDKIGKTVAAIKKKSRILTFDEMSAKELSKVTGLPIHLSRLAKKRRYDIPFKVLIESDRKEIISIIRQNGLKYVRGGLFSHVSTSDKGKAVKLLINMYKKVCGEITSIGLGDSQNDFAMLEVVDMPYLVQRHDKSYASNKFGYAQGVGPVGWNKVINQQIR